MDLLPQLRTEPWRNARAFVRYWDEIAVLRRDLGVEDDVLLDPLHFLSTTDNTRRPFAVACWSGEKLAGLVYATEHYVFGCRSGYAAGGDFAGRGLLLCQPENENEIVQASVKEMMRRGIHAMHLRLWPSRRTPPTLPGARVRCIDMTIPGDRMVLPGSFDEFLGTLGKHTRRNVRYYTRKAVSEGIAFVPALTKEEYRAGVERLNAKSTFPAHRSQLARDERLLALHSRSQRMGLRDAQGRLLAVLAGFSSANRFHLLTQFNDVQQEKLSLSVVLRGQSIEHLIAAGHTELHFLGGTSLSFGRFCTPRPYRSIYVDKKGWALSTVKQLGSGFMKLTAITGRRPLARWR